MLASVFQCLSWPGDVDCSVATWSDCSYSRLDDDYVDEGSSNLDDDLVHLLTITKDISCFKVALSSPTLITVHQPSLPSPLTFSLSKLQTS
jgi:hypothetical protein